MTLIAVKDLSLTRGASLFAGLTLTIAKGDRIGLIAATGRGTSTLLRGFSRLLKPRKGNVLLESQDIWKLPTKELAKRRHLEAFPPK